MGCCLWKWEGFLTQSLIRYLQTIYLGIRSMLRSLGASLPYLFRVRSGELRKEVTEQYPDRVSSRTPDDLPPRSRGILHNDIEKCTGCADCVRICPVSCIELESEPGPLHSKLWVSVFDIDLGKCTFCGMCVEVCQPASLTHARDYESASSSREGLKVGYGRGRVTPEQRAKWEEIRRFEEENRF